MTVPPIRTALLLCFAVAAVPAAAQTGTLVVLNKAAASASIIDVASGATLATLPTGDGPHEVVISADGRTAVGTDYGGRSGGNSLTVIDVPSRRVVRTIDLGGHGRPHGIAFLPGDSLVAVTSESARRVVIVRVGDGEIVRTIGTDQGGSHMLAIVGDASRIYTSNGQDHSVSELDVAAGRRTRTFAVPPRPEAITVTRDGAEVWVGSNADGTLNVLEPETGEHAVVAEGFGWPYRILITPDQQTVLVPDLRGNTLRFFDRAARRETGRIDFPGAAPQGIVLTADARFAFLSLNQQDRVAVIDLTRREVVRYLQTGSRPDGIAYTERTGGDGRGR